MTNVGELIARVRLRARLNRLPCLRPLMWPSLHKLELLSREKGLLQPLFTRLPHALEA